MGNHPFCLAPIWAYAHIGAMLQTRTLSAEGQSIHCVTAGDGPPLLFIHGWPTHAGLYRNIMPAVGADRKAIAIDFPGYGHSSKPTDVRYSLKFYGRIVQQCLDQLDVDRVGLVVHDLGGPVGLHWAVENQDRVSELIVLNTLAFPELHWMVKVFVAGVSLPGVAQALTSSRGLRGSIKFGTKTKPASEVLDLYDSPFTSPSDRRALAMAGRHIGVGSIAKMAKKLPELDVPTLLLYGTNDRILPDVAVTMERLAAIWPHAKKIALPGVGHFLQEDAPKLVAGHLVDFCRRDA